MFSHQIRAFPLLFKEPDELEAVERGSYRIWSSKYPIYLYFIFLKIYLFIYLW